MQPSHPAGSMAHKGRWPHAIGTIEDCLDNLPHTLLATSRGLGWRDLTLDVHPGSGQFELDVPPLDHVVIMMAQCGGAQTEGILDGRSYRHVVQPFDINIYPPLLRHACWGNRTPEALTIEIATEFLDQAAGTLTDGKRSTLTIEPALAMHDPVLRNFHQILLDELGTPSHPAQAMFVGALAAAISVHIARTYGHIGPAPPQAARRLPARTLAVIKDYMETHLTDSIQLDDLAAIAGLSRFHFIRVFKAGTGLTPMQYVERTRIAFACRLMEAGAMPLVDIAHLVGFADQSHFTRRFKLHIGCTPGTYARDHAPVSARPHDGIRGTS